MNWIRRLRDYIEDHPPLGTLAFFGVIFLVAWFFGRPYDPALDLVPRPIQSPMETPEDVVALDPPARPLPSTISFRVAGGPPVVTIDLTTGRVQTDLPPWDASMIFWSELARTLPVVREQLCRDP